jgi:hypothetical protein
MTDRLIPDEISPFWWNSFRSGRGQLQLVISGCALRSSQSQRQAAPVASTSPLESVAAWRPKASKCSSYHRNFFPALPDASRSAQDFVDYWTELSWCFFIKTTKLTLKVKTLLLLCTFWSALRIMYRKGFIWIQTITNCECHWNKKKIRRISMITKRTGLTENVQMLLHMTTRINL